jgi:hypothetical protein
VQKRHLYIPRILRVTNGWQFEKLVFDKSSEGIQNLEGSERTSFSEAIWRVIGSQDPIHTELSDALSGFVWQYLRPFLASSGMSLQLYSAVRTLADLHHGTDAFLILRNPDQNDGPVYVVTLDAFCFNGDAFSLMRDVFPERFTEVLEMSLGSVAKSLLANRYLDFQNALFKFKLELKRIVPFPREDNHFILTNFDFERGRGLRQIGRAIAASFLRQIDDEIGTSVAKKLPY